MDTSAPITKVAFQTANGWFSLLPDATASVSMVAGTGRIDVQHGANAYVLRSALVPQAPPVVTPPPPIPPVTVPAQPSTGDKPVLTVGPGQQYPHIGAAMDVLSQQAASQGRDGRALVGTIQVLPVPSDPTYYDDDYVPHRKPWGLGLTAGGDLVVEALPLFVGGKRQLVYVPVTLAQLEYGKAPFDVSGKFVLRGFRVDGIVPYGNVAAVRTEGGAFEVLIEDCEMINWGDCVFGTTSGGGVITIRRTLLQNGGTDRNTQHNFYMGELSSLLVEDCLSIGGRMTCHLGKSRALKTTIRRSRFFDGPDSGTSYGIDIPNGGSAIVSDVTIYRNATCENWPALAYAAERTAGVAVPGRTDVLTVDGLTVVSDVPDPDGRALGTVAIANPIGAPAAISGVRLWGVKRQYQSPGGIDLPMPGGAVVLTKRPVLDLSSPVFAR